MVYRPNSDFSLFLYSSLAKNGFCILKGCKEPKQKQRNAIETMWTSVPKILSGPVTGKVC